MESQSQIEKRFCDKFNLSEDQISEVKVEIAEALETGSEARQQKNIDALFTVYEKVGFVKTGKLGGGAFGDVYYGLNLTTKENVAIKVIDLEEAKDDILVIRREVMALADSQNCPQLVNYKGTAMKDTELWIVMEHVKGGSLNGMIKKKRLAEDHCAIIAREVLHGLVYLNSLERIHRDLKAANIMVQDDGQVKLGDLGASGQLSHTTPQAATFVGSPYWMAPEIIQSEKYGAKADIWSLGITMLECVNGKPPHSNLPPLQAVMRIPMSEAPKLEGDYSSDFKDFVQKCLTKDPKERSSAKELLSHPFIAGAKPCSEMKTLL